MESFRPAGLPGLRFIEHRHRQAGKTGRRVWVRCNSLRHLLCIRVFLSSGPDNDTLPGHLWNYIKYYPMSGQVLLSKLRRLLESRNPRNNLEAEGSRLVTGMYILQLPVLF